jgi:EAL domain-containing protein (putative c-di-GMP-specific phosphodiesterase class I)
MLRTRHAASIVQAVLQLAASLGLNVVAEGVEEEAQWDQLRALGCNSFQGYLFAKPMALYQLGAMYESDPCPS